MTRTVTAGFSAAAAKTGTRPVWLLELDAGGATYYWADYALTVGVQNYSARVESWGAISSINDRNSGGGIVNRTAITVVDLPTSISSLIRPGNEARIFLWFDGEGLGAADRLQVFEGMIADPIEAGLESITFSLLSIESKRNAVIGELLNATEYPGADPDDIGAVKPVVYGAVSGHKCLAIDAGSLSSLVLMASTSATSLELTDASGYPATGTIKIDREEITYTGKTDNTLTGCTRGANSTIAVPHDAGSQVIEVQVNYDYLIADHPVTSIGNVYVDRVRVISGVTKLLNDAGQAKLRFDARPILENEAAIALADQLTIVESGHTHNQSGGGSLGVTYTGCSGSLCANIAPGSGSGVKIYSNYAGTSPIVYQNYTIIGKTGNPISAVVQVAAVFSCPNNYDGHILIDSNVCGWNQDHDGTLKTFTISVNDWNDVEALRVQWNSCTQGMYIYEVKLVSVTYSISGTIGTATANVGRNGTITLTGNSVAETKIGRVISCDLVGYNVEKPDDVIGHLLLNYSNGIVPGDLDASIAAGTLYPASTKVGFSITTQTPLMTLCRTIAHQTLARFFWEAGTAFLSLIPIGTLPARAIGKDDVILNSLVMKWTPIKDIINKISAPYDWREDKGTFNSLDVQAAAGSIAIYGDKDGSARADLTVVNDATTATATNAGLLSLFSAPLRVLEFNTPLKNIDLQRADTCTVTHDIDGGLVQGFEVLQVDLVPGSGPRNQPDSVRLVLLEIAP